MPYREGAVRAIRTVPVDSASSGWYRLRPDGSYPSTREAAPESWHPKPTEVGQRFQFMEAGQRSRGASPIITVRPAPLPEDRRAGYVHKDVLVNAVGELKPYLQPGYRLTAHNPWPVGQTVTHAWLHNGKIVDGATTPVYVLKASDAGATIQAVVRTGRPGYVSNDVKARS